MKTIIILPIIVKVICIIYKLKQFAHKHLYQPVTYSGLGSAATSDGLPGSTVSFLVFPFGSGVTLVLFGFTTFLHCVKTKSIIISLYTILQ